MLSPYGNWYVLQEGYLQIARPSFRIILNRPEPGDTGDEKYMRDGLTILRAIAKHHQRDTGFLTEGVDWNNHVGKQHHFDEAEYGDIKYTEPLLNNLHILEPTLIALELGIIKE